MPSPRQSGQAAGAEGGVTRSLSVDMRGKDLSGCLLDFVYLSRAVILSTLR